MAFSVAERVQVSAHNNQYRGQYGTIEAADGDYWQVRVDGMPTRGRALFSPADLLVSTQPAGIDYPE